MRLKVPKFAQKGLTSPQSLRDASKNWGIAVMSWGLRQRGENAPKLLEAPLPSSILHSFFTPDILNAGLLQ